MDLKMDRDETKDMEFVNGACPVTDDYVDSTAQRIFVMLRTFESEWFLNVNTGVPYHKILGTKMQREQIDRVMQAKILAERGVAEILQYTSIMQGNRVYEASFRVRATTGGIIEQAVTIGD